jgi:gas vesicle protein
MENKAHKIFMAFLTGDVDENEQYFTEDMITSSHLLGIIMDILNSKGIIAKEELEQAKKEFVKAKNKNIKRSVKELRERFKLNTKKESVEDERR